MKTITRLNDKGRKEVTHMVVPLELVHFVLYHLYHLRNLVYLYDSRPIELNTFDEEPIKSIYMEPKKQLIKQLIGFPLVKNVFLAA
jgi:hypothetical protein